MSDIVERLRMKPNTTGEREAADEIERLQELTANVPNLLAEIERLQKRLEIDHCHQINADGEMVRVELSPLERENWPDGIECRDETIRLLDANIERLRDWKRKQAEDIMTLGQMVGKLEDEIERLRAEHPDSGEPVAWRCVADDGVSDVTEIEGVADQWRSDGFAVTPLYAAPGSAGARNEALEEAAKVAADWVLHPVKTRSVAAAIRALKEKEP